MPARAEADLAPAIPQIWRSEIQAIRADLRGWLQQKAAARTRLDARILRAELRPRRSPGPRPAQPQGAREISGGFQLQGSIDLVERHASGVLRVVDHKTGNIPDPRPRCVGAGEVLQPTLYALAAEKILGEPVAVRPPVLLHHRAELRRHRCPAERLDAPPRANRRSTSSTTPSQRLPPRRPAQRRLQALRVPARLRPLRRGARPRKIASRELKDACKELALMAMTRAAPPWRPGPVSTRSPRRRSLRGHRQNHRPGGPHRRSHRRRHARGYHRRGHLHPRRRRQHEAARPSGAGTPPRARTRPRRARPLSPTPPARWTAPSSAPSTPSARNCSGAAPWKRASIRSSRNSPSPTPCASSRASFAAGSSAGFPRPPPPSPARSRDSPGAPTATRESRSTNSAKPPGPSPNGAISTRPGTSAPSLATPTWIALDQSRRTLTCASLRRGAIHRPRPSAPCANSSTAYSAPARPGSRSRPGRERDSTPAQRHALGQAGRRQYAGLSREAVLASWNELKARHRRVPPVRRCRSRRPPAR